MLFSRIVRVAHTDFDNTRKIVIEITATGIEALTVKPTFNTRYSDEAPKTIPSSVPIIKGLASTPAARHPKVCRDEMSPGMGCLR